MSQIPTTESLDDSGSQAETQHTFLPASIKCHTTIPIHVHRRAAPPTLALSIRTKGGISKPLSILGSPVEQKKRRNLEAQAIHFLRELQSQHSIWFPLGPKRSTTQIWDFRPTLAEAQNLIYNFGDLAFNCMYRLNPVRQASDATCDIVDPGMLNANYYPWVHLSSTSHMAASPSTSKSGVLDRMRGNVAAANALIEKRVAKWSERGDDEWLADWLVDAFETYFNRRATLIKELEILKAKDVVKSEIIKESKVAHSKAELLKLEEMMAGLG